MTEVVRVSVEVWKSGPDAFCYNPVGYMASVDDTQSADIDTMRKRYYFVGSRSSNVEGEPQVFTYLRYGFPDWKAR